MAKSIKFDIPDTGKFFLTEEISLSIASTENDGILSWVATSPAGKTSEIGTEPTINIKLSDYFTETLENIGNFEIVCYNMDGLELDKIIDFPVTLDILETGQSPTERYNFAPYTSQITSIIDDKIGVRINWDDYVARASFPTNLNNPTDDFQDVTISYKVNDYQDLNTYLHFGGNSKVLITNAKSDKITYDKSPFSTVFKTYQPLPDEIEERDQLFIVREVLPQLTETVELIPYAQEDEEVAVLKTPDSIPKDSPITNRTTEFKNYNQLVTSNKDLKNEILDKFMSGSERPVKLNVDYSNYENFVNFSSAEKRLSNFKYKLQLIETYTTQSGSKAGVTNAENDRIKLENQIRDLKVNFDGYEDYLYNVSSSYVSSSMGIFPSGAVPKTGSGTFLDPFVPVTSSAADFTSWYGSVINKTGQIYTASLYDAENQNRLVNLLPLHIKEDENNSQFLNFLDMVGQHFDELWLYTKALADITDRNNDLRDGFSKDLIFNIAKSLGWDTQDGKDLLDLSQIGFGQKVSGSGFFVYTSGSLDSPPEGDVSKEITKRLISSMPYILKSKGTLGSLKAIINCYGIPSSILRVREYGGLDSGNSKAQFEIARKFTKALGFRSSQFVKTSWDDDDNSNRKPETIEFRFRALSGSNQVLVQKDADWAIRLKDNPADDNNGTLSFMLSGSDGYKEVSSSVMPLYDGDFYSVMLRKSKVNLNLFATGSFEEATTLFNPPFITGSNSAEFGALSIVSSSGVARTGDKALKFQNTSTDKTSYSYLYRKDSTSPGLVSSIASVSKGQTYSFTVFAKASGSQTDSVASINLFELDDDSQVVNWTTEEPNTFYDGGIATSKKVGLNETEWKQLQVRKTIKFSNTSKLAIRFEVNKPNTSVLFDDVEVRKLDTNTDTLADAFSYDLFVKKYDSGLDRIRLESRTSLLITGSHAATQSYNAAWTGSGDLFIGGNTTTPFGSSKLTGSLMEFRLWTEPLDEEAFDIHVSNPKSYIGNTASSSYTNLVRRFSFDDDKTLANNASLLDTSANQTYTQSGSAQGFGGKNTFEAVVDKTKTIVPNAGPNRRMATKIRIEDNYLSGSGASLSVGRRYDKSSNDYAPLDSNKLGVFFSPTDVINEDIISSFANLDFNQYIGDPRDIFDEEYGTLKNISDDYFKKYSGNNNFFDFLQLIKYYDQNIFNQLKKVIPARANANLGTLVEGNIFERRKSPVQRNNPTITQPSYEDTINLSILEQEHQDSRSIVIIETEYPNYEDTITAGTDIFQVPSLYRLHPNDNFSDRNLYSGSTVTYGGPTRIFEESTGSIISTHRTSPDNFAYSFFYTSSLGYARSNKFSVLKNINLYNSKSLDTTDIDPEYQNFTALNNSFYEGVKNTDKTTLDGLPPIIERTTAKAIAVPKDFGTSKLDVLEDE